MRKSALEQKRNRRTPFELAVSTMRDGRGGEEGNLLGIRIEEVGGGKAARNKLALRLTLVEAVYARAAWGSQHDLPGGRKHSCCRDLMCEALQSGLCRLSVYDCSVGK